MRFPLVIADRLRRLGPWRVGVATVLAAVAITGAVLVIGRGDDHRRVTTDSTRGLTSSSSSPVESSNAGSSSSTGSSSGAPAASAETSESSSLSSDAVPEGPFVRVSNGSLVVSRFDGSDRRVLIEGDASHGVLTAVTSPDHARVAASIGSPGAVTSLEVVDVVNGARTMIASGPASMPKWSSDGQWLAYVDADGLRVVLASGGDAQLIARDADMPDWSQDGTEIAYALRPGVVDADGDSPIHVVQRDGSNDRPLKDPNDGGATKDTAPVFAPDGAHLLLERQNADGSQLAVIAAADATSWRSFPNFVDEVPTSDVAWLDSSSVFLVEVGWYRLDLVAIDGSGQRPATDGVLRQAAASSDRTMLAWITQEGEVRVRDLRTAAETELVPTGGPSSGLGMGLLTWSPDNAAIAVRGNDHGWSVYRVDGSAQWAFADA